MKNKIAVHANSFHGFTFEEALKTISEAGFQYVELAAVRGWTEHVMPDMSEAELQAAKDLLEKYHLTAVGLSGHCNLMEAERLEDFKQNIHLAQYFGCEYIITSTGEAHHGENEVFTDDELVANIKTLLPTLEACNVKLVLEIHGEYGTGCQLVELTKKINSPYVGLNYDTANCYFYGKVLPEEEVKLCGEEVQYVHLKDHLGASDVWNFPGLGNGDLKLEAFMKHLDSIGYTGPYSIEIEYTGEFTMREKVEGDLAVPKKEVEDSYAYLKALGRV